MESAMRILCVDDDATARAVYVGGLEEALPDDQVVEAASGEEAVDRLGRESFDVVLTDLVMPGISGLEVLRAAKSHSPSTEVIVVTGQASVDTAVDAMRRGARDYLEKPINIPLLVEKLDNLRDLVARARDAEEMRLVKEQTEREAGRAVHELEQRLQQMQEAVNGAVELLRSCGGHEDSQVCAQAESLLAPFLWAGRE